MDWPAQLSEPSPTALAAAYTGADPAARNAAAAGLVYVIQQLARRVAASSRTQDRNDFVDDAPLLILVGPNRDRPPPIAAFDAGKGRFTTWVCAVLRNLWATRRRRETPVSLPDGFPVEAPSDPGDGGTSPLLAPFDPPDLRTLGGWEPALRLELLVLCGLWAKVPAAIWDGWVREYEAGRPGLALPHPFPPADWDPAGPPGDRTAPLAGLLGYRPNFLSVRRNRLGGRLRELAFVRDLLG